MRTGAGSVQELPVILRARDDLHMWDEHPIICSKAVLPTMAIGATASLVIAQGRKQRGCAAFWAHPCTGKSSCIRALVTMLAERFPGAGIVVHEAKSNTVCAEGTFVKDILYSCDYQGRIQHDLADKREQLRRALFAIGAHARHIFFIVDEAQELAEKEFRWIKEQGNWLVKHDFRVTTVLFGQEELLDVMDTMVSHGRSDLVERFFGCMCEFERIKTRDAMLCSLKACDVDSEYPVGTGWSYTHFLWPRAFASGFRLTDQCDPLWETFIHLSPMTRGDQGISMNYIADALANMADLTKDRDSAHFEPTECDWQEAIRRTGYIDRALSAERGRELRKNSQTA